MMHSTTKFKEIPTPDNVSMKSNWTMGGISRLSLAMEESTTFFELQDYHLQLKQKIETKSPRPIIPATKMQRLSFYRAFVTSPIRKQLLVMQNIHFNDFLWNYVVDLFLKMFPHTFVHIFLATYTPEEHMFLPKMVPISLGCNYTLVIASFMELITYVHILVILCVYATASVVFQNPWNRCMNKTYTDSLSNDTVYCYEMEEFSKQFQNKSPYFNLSSYVSETKEQFQLSQMVYYRLYRDTFARNVVFFLFLWVGFGVLHRRVLAKTFWKLLHRCQWTVNAMNIVILVYLGGIYIQMHLENKKDIHVPIFKEPQILWRADLDTISASTTTTPPVVHVLTARSTQTINPSGDCTMIIISNAISYILRGLLMSRVKKYCEFQLQAPLWSTRSNRFSWFYFYSIFFAQFYLGDIFTMVYFTMSAVTEILVVNVVYYCFIESVIYEWKWLKRWLAVSMITVFGILAYCCTTYMSRYIFCIYAKGISTLCEIVLMYSLYPLGRLFDDYTFHFGDQLTTLRVWSFRLVPVYYSIKLYNSLSAFVYVMKVSEHPKFPENYKWTWSIAFVPILLGVIVVIYRYAVLQRKDWRYVFRPVPNWGPKDFTARQLRKQYDSRTYIASQNPRLLSRYLIKKGEADAYRLRINYETNRRRSTMADFRFMNEKK